jgi:thiamine-phosphate pyrophosphorylase
MLNRPLLYYVTDRKAFGSDESTRRQRLLEKITEAARSGVDYIQLREKDLSIRDLESLAREAIKVIRENSSPREQSHQLRPDRQPPALLINSRADVALATGADGVHLRSDDITPNEIREIWQATCGRGRLARATLHDPLIAVSCHSPADVAQAATHHATFAVFGPVFEKLVFEKKDAPASLPAGLAQLREASRTNIPVLALGGITLSNARSCLEAGAAGIAAIRLFQENNIAEIVRLLR